MVSPVLFGLEEGGILRYTPEDLTIQVSSRFTCSALKEALAARRQWIPALPTSEGTIGGWLAADLRGAFAGTLGTARDYLLQVEWIDSLGNLLQAGAPVVKSVAGYDIPKLMIGSLGQIGFITEVVLKVLPQPDSFFLGRWDTRQENLAQNTRQTLPAGIWRTRLDNEELVWVGVLGREAATSWAAEELTPDKTYLDGDAQKQLEVIEAICSGNGTSLAWGGAPPSRLSAGSINTMCPGGNAVWELVRGHVWWNPPPMDQSAESAVQRQWHQLDGHLHIASSTKTSWGRSPGSELTLLQKIQGAMDPVGLWVHHRWPGGV
jgi:hypothetical protein